MNTLKSIWRVVYGGWMKFAYVLGTINRYVLMTLFYWVIIDITNLVMRIGRVDLLDRRFRPKPTYWHVKSAQTSGTYENQF